MPESLFGDDRDALIPEDLERRLLAAYRTEPLEYPPVPSLGRQNPARENLASLIARKDLSRLIRAMERAGLVIREKEED